MNPTCVFQRGFCHAFLRLSAVKTHGFSGPFPGSVSFKCPVAGKIEQNSKIPAKKWGDTEIAERGRSVLVMRARYRSAGLTPHQRGWTDAG